MSPLLRLKLGLKHLFAEGRVRYLFAEGRVPSKKWKKVNVCLGGQKISMLNKTQNKGREPAGIYSKS
jgi:hypothetical protein